MSLFPKLNSAARSTYLSPQSLNTSCFPYDFLLLWPQTLSLTFTGHAILRHSGNLSDYKDNAVSWFSAIYHGLPECSLLLAPVRPEHQF